MLFYAGVRTTSGVQTLYTPAAGKLAVVLGYAIENYVSSMDIAFGIRSGATGMWINEIISVAAGTLLRDPQCYLVATPDMPIAYYASSAHTHVVVVSGYLLTP